MHINIKDIFYKWKSLFLISCFSLFMELAVIRWISGEIRLFAYFKNLILLAAFMGFAIGFALVGKADDYKKTFPWLLGMFVILVLVIGKVTENQALIYPGGGDVSYWIGADLSFWKSLLIFLAIICVFFFLTLFLFIPLGQATGEEMAKHLPVPSYIVNIIASLAGVWLFSLISYLNTPPVLWFALAIIGIGIFFFYNQKLTWQIGISFSITLVAIGFINPNTIWSPYSRLDLSPEIISNGNEQLQWGYVLNVQHTFYQRAYDLSDRFLDKISKTFPNLQGSIEEYARLYDLPYQLASTGNKVLIVGSGMGNDVAAALRSDMGQIVAVEIDPSILELGRKYHPEKPYDDPRVTTVVDDARSFLNRSLDKYDLVIFAFLDSHSLLSSMSSVRLDSFVYTLESFEQAKSHLTENGYVVVSFAANEWIEERLGRMLEEVFGQGKVYNHKWIDGITFAAGINELNPSLSPQFSLWKSNSEFNDLPLPTDNWPFIYLRSLRIPAGEWQTLLIIGLLCIAMMARSFPEALKPNWHFWLLGAAFLLIEFKSITELALLFGTTWFVNSLAISGVLIMVLFANLIVWKIKKMNLRWIYMCLFVSLVFGYSFPLTRLASFTPLVKGIIGTTILCSPLFFAGMIFSESLKRYGETSRPLASNFSGSAVGGILEYGSIWWGIKNLYLVAFVLYIGAMIAAIKGRLLSK